MKIIKKPKQKNLETLKKWASSAHEDWELAFKNNFLRASTCSKFLFGIQEWDPAAVALRNAQDKETVSANFCNKFYKQIKSELLEVNVTLNVEATTDLADDEQLLDQEIIRQIVLSSDNLDAFKKELDDCLVNGFGVAEVYKKYEDGQSLNEILSVRPVKNLHACFFDLTSADQTFSKGRYCGSLNQVSGSALQLNYPALHDKKRAKPWVTEQLVDVWDFYWKESYEETYYEINPFRPWVTESLLSAEEFVKRKSFKKKRRALPLICRARFTEHEFLIEPEVYYKGSRLPLIYWPILTQRIFKDQNASSGGISGWSGLVTTPYIYHFLGLQQAYNYALSQSTTLVAQATGRKYFLTKEQASADLERWATINSQSGTIFYSKDNLLLNGQGQGQAPVQIQVDATEPLPASLLTYLQVLQNTFNDLSGNTAASQGEQDNTVSGAAADIKVSQSNLTNRQMITAHIHAIDAVGDLLQQWIPQVYKERRTYRLPTGRLTVLNDRKYDAMRGETIKNDIRDLMSSLKIKVGSGVSTRQERKSAIQSLINIMSTTQNSLAILGPVLAMNWEGDGKDILEKLLLTQLSKDQFELLKGRITEDQYFASIAQEQAPDPKQELVVQKLSAQIANLTATTQAAQARSQKAMMDTSFVEKQIKEPPNVEKTVEYSDLAKEKQIAQIRELKIREQLALKKLKEPNR